MASAPYDPYLGGEPAAGGVQGAPGNQRTAALQAVSYHTYPQYEMAIARFRYLDKLEAMGNG
jgi:hypothetical protein